MQERENRERFDLKPGRTLIEVIAENACLDAADSEIEQLFDHIKEQPDEHPALYGNIPGWRDCLWLGFGEGAVKRGELSYAIKALSEMGNFARKRGITRRLASVINERIPFA